MPTDPAEKLLALTRPLLSWTTPDLAREAVLRGSYVSDTGCWIWARSLSVLGYGNAGHKWLQPNGQRTGFAHRIAWIVFFDYVPDGFVLDHVCRTPACVRPGHLRVVTQRQNLLAAATSVTSINAGRTQCPLGHELLPSKSGRSRSCSACPKERWRRYNARPEVKARKRAYQRLNHEHRLTLQRLRRSTAARGAEV